MVSVLGSQPATLLWARIEYHQMLVKENAYLHVGDVFTRGTSFRPATISERVSILNKNDNHLFITALVGKSTGTLVITINCKGFLQIFPSIQGYQGRLFSWSSSHSAGAASLLVVVSTQGHLSLLPLHGRLHRLCPAAGGPASGSSCSACPKWHAASAEPKQCPDHTDFG